MSLIARPSKRESVKSRATPFNGRQVGAVDGANRPQVGQIIEVRGENIESPPHVRQHSNNFPFLQEQATKEPVQSLSHPPAAGGGGVANSEPQS